MKTSDSVLAYIAALERAGAPSVDEIARQVAWKFGFSTDDAKRIVENTVIESVVKI